ncbi:MAG: LA_1612 family putative O-antigen biosynthesis protein, partial [Ilumatobacteraceae bacterium]
YVTETDVAIYENPRERLNVWVALRMLLSRDLSEFSYYRAFLRWRKPKFVITMEDNNVTFYATKVISPECKTLAIQNGVRNAHSHSADSNFKTELQQLHQMGYDADVIGTLGGLGSTFYRGALPNSRGKLIELGHVMNNALSVSGDGDAASPRRLVFISKFPNRGEDGVDPEWDSKVIFYMHQAALTAKRYYNVEGIVARTCAAIASEHSMQFVVLGKRPAWQVGEYNYFAEHLQGLSWQYLPSSNQASSYEAIRPSDVIVNVDSTLGYELFSRGLRVAFVAARMHAAGHPEIVEQRFGYPLLDEPTGPFWTSEATDAEIRRVVGTAISVSEEQWIKMTDSARQMLFQYDRANARLCSELDRLGIRNSGPRLWTRELIPLN